MRYLILLFLLTSFAVASAATDPKSTPKPETTVCVKTTDLTSLMESKNFYHLLNMSNKNGVVETLWVSGTDIVITAQEKDSSCVIAMMKDVVYNPDTIKGLLKAYENQTKNQKDI